MPTFQGQVTEEQILQLVAYIKSVGPQQKQVPATSTAATAKPGASPAAAEAGAKPKAE